MIFSIQKSHFLDTNISVLVQLIHLSFDLIHSFVILVNYFTYLKITRLFFIRNKE